MGAASSVTLTESTINNNDMDRLQVMSFRTFKQSYTSSDHRVIRLINFQSFKDLGTFPRFPDHQHLTTSLNDIDEKVYDESLFIFVSHCWLRGWSGAKGWDGRPHPDNAEGGKYDLCVEGINQVLQTLVSGMKECYLWLDFGCIDQDGNPADELKYLDKIVQVCDVLFTPICDDNHSSWEWPTLLSLDGWYVHYESPAWKEGPYAYLNRGWCRVEMFYGSNIPLLEDGEERRGRMKAGLLFHRSEGRRPHILYGTKQQAIRYPPIVLPPLQNTYFKKYNPIEGSVTKKSDKENIKRLVKELEPYMKKATVRYEGDRDKRGMMHGKGKYTFADGDVYEGDYKDDKIHGKGKYTFADGNVYEGDWEDDKRHGKGKYTYSNGNVYEGDWKDNKIHGKGKYTYADGDVYEGDYKDDKRHGKGKYTYVNGDVYEGDYKDDKGHGKGKYTYANGDAYEGDWKDDKKHGKGKYTYSNGNVYEGDWEDDKRHGKGKYTCASGNVYEGDYKDNKRHGKGKFSYASGQVVIQIYENNNLISEHKPSSP